MKERGRRERSNPKAWVRRYNVQRQHEAAGMTMAMIVNESETCEHALAIEVGVMLRHTVCMYRAF